MEHRHYYAASSYMGINYTYDSPCWSLQAFDSKIERDNWVDEDTQHRESVDQKTARKICPWLHNHNPHDDQTGYYSFNTGREVFHITEVVS